MAKGLTDDSSYQAIADAIRTKNGSSESYLPEEMAAAVLALRGTAYPALEVPAEYADKVKYAVENLYTGSYANLAVLEQEDEIVVAFLMEGFSIASYDLYSTEFTATGMYLCSYAKSDGTWTSHDYTTETSPGSSYARYIVFASCRVKYGEQILFPVGVTNTVKSTSISYDDEAGNVTQVFATGQTEVYTWVKDDSGAITGVTDSQGHTTTLAGVSV